LWPVFALGLGGRAGGGLHVVGHAVQFVGAGEIREGIGGVQGVFAELLASSAWRS
jgi:hypothetical protein